jgi:hypothetical protein
MLGQELTSCAPYEAIVAVFAKREIINNKQNRKFHSFIKIKLLITEVFA